MNVLFNYFKKFFTEQLKKQEESIIIKALAQSRQEYLDNSRKAKISELFAFVGSPVICVSNENDDLTVGFGRNIDMFSNTPILVVHDYIRGEDVFVMGKIYHYNEVLLQNLVNNNRNFINTLIYNTRYTEKDIVKGTSKTPGDFFNKLNQTKFYNDLRYWTYKT